MTWREAFGQLAKSVFGLVIVAAALVLAGALWGLHEISSHRAETEPAHIRR